MTSRRINVIATIVLLGSMAGGAVTVNALDRARVRSEAAQTLYIRSATALRRMSLGYTGLLADIDVGHDCLLAHSPHEITARTSGWPRPPRAGRSRCTARPLPADPVGHGPDSARYILITES